MRGSFFCETIIGRVLLIVAFPATDGNKKERNRNRNRNRKRKRKRKKKRKRERERGRGRGRFAREALAKGGVRWF